jgi:predicted phage tail protein
MKTVYLHGELADKFTDKVVLDIHSVGEAIRALKANFKGFTDYLQNYTPGFHIKIGEIYKDKDELNDLVSDSEDIHIIPAIAGSGKLGTIIIGAFLIWATWGVGATALAAGNSTAAALGAGWAAAVPGAAIASQIGVGLVLAGISALLFAPPKSKINQKEENTPNTYFSGAVNTIAQGNPVPIGYGELIVGSAVISAGISVDSIGTANAPWMFTSLGQDGWIVDSGNVYINEITNIKYDSTTGKYTHSTIRNVDPSFYGIHCYIDGETNIEVCQEIAPNGDLTSVVRPSGQQTYTYEYTPVTGMFKRIAPSCNLFSNTDNYCSTNGSAVKPEEWGTK